MFSYKRRVLSAAAGAAAGCLQVINERYKCDDEQGDEQPKRERLMPRTEDLPIYSVAEFNDKV